eukprot:1108631-Alexandrium_andersonii.AAC.1
MSPMAGPPAPLWVSSSARVVLAPLQRSFPPTAQPTSVGGGHAQNGAADGWASDAISGLVFAASRPRPARSFPRPT